MSGKWIAACVLAALVSVGCASGPKYTEIEARIPPVADGNGRIFFYRTQRVGAAIQPQVRVNDEPVGPAKARGFFFVDRPEGDYEVACSTEVKNRQTLRLESKETRYVKLGVAMGILVGRVVPKLVAAEEGLKDLQDLHYIGAEELLTPSP